MPGISKKNAAMNHIYDKIYDELETLKQNIIVYSDYGMPLPELCRHLFPEWTPTQVFPIGVTAARHCENALFPALDYFVAESIDTAHTVADMKIVLRVMMQKNMNLQEACAPCAAVYVLVDGLAASLLKYGQLHSSMDGLVVIFQQFFASGTMSCEKYTAADAMRDSTGQHVVSLIKETLPEHIAQECACGTSSALLLPLLTLAVQKLQASVDEVHSMYVERLQACSCIEQIKNSIRIYGKLGMPTQLLLPVLSSLLGPDLQNINHQHTVLAQEQFILALLDKMLRDFMHASSHSDSPVNPHTVKEFIKTMMTQNTAIQHLYAYNLQEEQEYALLCHALIQYFQKRLGIEEIRQRTALFVGFDIPISYSSLHSTEQCPHMHPHSECDTVFSIAFSTIMREIDQRMDTIRQLRRYDWLATHSEHHVVESIRSFRVFIQTANMAL